jgi:hypothetical protein
MFFIGNRFKKSFCLFLNPIIELLLFCLYMLVIPMKYVYTNKHPILIRLTIGTTVLWKWACRILLRSMMSKKEANMADFSGPSSSWSAFRGSTVLDCATSCNLKTAWYFVPILCHGVVHNKRIMNILNLDNSKWPHVSFIFILYFTICNGKLIWYKILFIAILVRNYE